MWNLMFQVILNNIFKEHFAGQNEAFFAEVAYKGTFVYKHTVQ